MKRILLKTSLIILLFCLTASKVYPQYTDGITGLLHLVNAEVQKDGTFMLGGNMLHRHNIPSKTWWGNYNTYNYYINITFFDRIEVAYICTLVQGKPGAFHWPEHT